MSTLSRIQATQSLFKVAEIDSDRLQLQCNKRPAPTLADLAGI